MAIVAKPSSRSTSERNPVALSMRPSKPGKPVALSEMPPMPVVCWFRPVNRQARVGEHIAVVWKLRYRKPFAASRSNVGVSTSEPKQPICA
ncbi:unannotated protein [freshwater metagenome]|uniref:Unannotated protein n=1 Tax=freshwater metagenome TaxID=449393 RepID=A0A6J7QQE4_9ZZZZ